MKNSEGLINFLIKEADKHKLEVITTKDVDDLLEAIFRNPDACVHGCDYVDLEVGDWIHSSCKRCGRQMWAHKNCLKMWRLLDEE